MEVKINTIASFFLRAKHWQIFLVVFGVYLLGQILLMSYFVSSSGRGDSSGKYGILFGVVMGLSCSGLIFWLWCVGAFCNSIVDEALRLRSKFHGVAAIYPPFYAVFFVARLGSFGGRTLEIILPLHLFAMFCMFYLLYFASKSIVLAEGNKPVSFYDYAGPFFLMWFFPVGIWLVQPRINRLYSEHTPSEQSAAMPIS